MQIKFYKNSTLEGVIDLASLQRYQISLRELLDLQVIIGRTHVQLGDSPREALPLEGNWCWCCGWPIEGGAGFCEQCRKGRNIDVSRPA